MPETIKLEDGTEREVLTTEEQESATKAIESVAEMDKFKEGLKLEEGQTIQTKFEELTKAADHPNAENVRKMGDAITKYKAALKEKGIDVDDNGDVINKDTLTREQIADIAKEQANVLIGEQSFEAKMLGYSEEERKSMDPLVKKLMTIGGSLEENISLAESKLYPERAKADIKTPFNPTGGAPNSKETDGKSYADTDEGANTAKALGLEIKKPDNK